MNGGLRAGLIRFSNPPFITAHTDQDGDGDVDGNDALFHFVYDERWRIVGMFEDGDTDPTEQYFYHNAGGGGLGSASYVDDVIRRDRDTGARAATGNSRDSYWDSYLFRDTRPAP